MPLGRAVDAFLTRNHAGPLGRGRRSPIFASWMAELRRFRWLAPGAAALLTGALLLVDRLADALLPPLAIYRPAGAVCVLPGLALGLYRATSYRRTSQWIALIHRPIAPGRKWMADRLRRDKG